MDNKWNRKFDKLRKYFSTQLNIEQEWRKRAEDNLMNFREKYEFELEEEKYKIILDYQKKLELKLETREKQKMFAKPRHVGMYSMVDEPGDSDHF